MSRWVGPLPSLELPCAPLLTVPVTQIARLVHILRIAPNPWVERLGDYLRKP
jgi:hypothetical protein